MNTDIAKEEKDRSTTAHSDIKFEISPMGVAFSIKLMYNIRIHSVGHFSKNEAIIFLIQVV